MSQPASLLRVMTGAVAGASKTLPASGRILVGHEFWHDIVLRDPSTRGTAVEIALEGDSAARITVLEGEAHVLGAGIAAGASALLPPYVPVRIGQVAFAWGEAEHPRWREAEALAASAAAEPAPMSEQAAALDTLSNRWQAGPGKAWRRVRVPILATGIAAALALLIVPPAVNAIQYGIGGEYKARRVLDTAGYKRLRVDKRDGKVEVTGTVATDADRLRIQRLLDEADVDAALSVQTGAGLARAVADVARLNGVQAEADRKSVV